MLYEENSSESTSGVYERERLRRRARKLGLQLVKTSHPRSQEPTHSTGHRSGMHPDAHADFANAAENGALHNEFDKCG